MKKLLTLTVLAILSTSASAKDLTGHYAYNHDVIIPGECSQTDKLNDNWEDCTYDGDDSVSIYRDDITDEMVVSVETITTNAHMCSFESTNLTILENSIIATETATDWDGSDLGSCEVTITVDQDDSATVLTNGNCQDFCGTRASLEFDIAHKQ